jgi:hypothetical protein
VRRHNSNEEEREMEDDVVVQLTGWPPSNDDLDEASELLEQLHWTAMLLAWDLDAHIGDVPPERLPRCREQLDEVEVWLKEIKRIFDTRGTEPGHGAEPSSGVLQ